MVGVEAEESARCRGQCRGWRLGLGLKARPWLGLRSALGAEACRAMPHRCEQLELLGSGGRRVEIGMALLGTIAVGLLELLVRGARLHSKHRVAVARVVRLDDPHGNG